MGLPESIILIQQPPFKRFPHSNKKLSSISGHPTFTNIFHFQLITTIFGCVERIESMAFRGGRGRGWGFGGGYFKSEPFVLFPDIELPDAKAVPEEKALVIWNSSLNQVLQLQSHNFPKELIQDSSRGQRSAKKMRWNLDSGLEKLDMFEKFEKESEGKEGKEKGDGEEDTDEEQGEQSDESYSDDGDYNENEHFDDDEDDFNVQDDGEDEPIY
ncbi:Basic helix-loop-helix DNA-binding superfamily protein isoform 1 [Hibiscus syriacus]|uniref:Basic helix-loop-helix DNA-binding superfamily protein isoform 1 n=1 Tax=Hibiscus syriacus TaxID=106335 RepID=A0A6A3D8E4_HIBSY|nr:Basic helix-loop-helix DNA-binding superfamily protein isoform 1 [Hibiscus syriacus]